MRKILYMALLVLSCSLAQAQSMEPAVDSTLLGTNIFATMPANVKVYQSPAVRSAVFTHVERNSEKMFTGFRIRIFNESAQNARAMSEAAEARFRAAYPGIATSRTYSAPFFTVTAGNFRTRVDAERALKAIRDEFPTAIIVKERFKYPSLGDQAPQADTLTVFKVRK